MLFASVANGATLTLAWDPPTDGKTTGYLFWFGTGSGKYQKFVDVGYVFRYRVDGLANDTLYCFAVQAYDASGSSSQKSTELCGRTPKAAPLPTKPSDPIGEGPVDKPEDPGSGDPVGEIPRDEDPVTTYPREIVLYASKGTPKGHWKAASAAGAAGGQLMRSSNAGWATPNTALASPAHYFEMRFNAAANTPYRVWLRLRATNNSKWNDSVWVQFSRARVNGRAAYQIGTTNALLVNLERCNACGLRSWGWLNSAYWLQQNAVVTFAAAGPQTIRIQTREDGVEIDQIVLSAGKYINKAPGAVVNDTTIVPLASMTTSTTTSAPFGVSPAAIRGKLDAAAFDIRPDWQRWTDVIAPVPPAEGRPRQKLQFNAEGMNFSSLQNQ